MQTYDSGKCKLFQVSCFLWVRDEDAGKMFRADAMFANVAKHICVFEESCWWFHFKSLSRLLHTLKESIIIIKLAFHHEKFGRASG